MTEIPAGPTPQRAIGVLASFDFTKDRELWRWAPDDVTLYLSRTDPAPSWEGLALVSALNKPQVLERATRELCTLRSEAVVYLCTACSFVGGVGGERALRQAMLDYGAPQALTTSGAVVDALRAVGAERVAVAHPYIESVGKRLHDYLTESGFTVTSSIGLGLQPAEIPAVPYDEVCKLVRESDHPDADAVFVSCSSLPTYDVIAPLERELGKPVITANQATIWGVLRAAGLSAVGPGQQLLTA
ncbi:maleate cis-trans isomerase family protein [Nocardia mexicana]|uniref:Maleate isomerase n=1 Tax=Nocardia mexicana TaxID=279262 RepID=A0A370HEJ7_9NOCA|nr:Asp/Glu racemase [Nocardia mexicana]RDI53313.1 maleate isomerase [Nocardia mexicana]